MPLFEAAIFDMDGTLVDNMAAHAQAWVQVSRRLGAPQPAATFARDWAGQKNEEIFERILG
ncbi:MAG TPA: HAD hydrolase-like protein, partial [Myxococcaceae bacterium]|nr:HAD hydrolase-like protein [Myxococcaceae bacterium]